MAFRTATSRRAGAGILGTLATALATGQPAPVLAATPLQGATQAAALAAPGTNLLVNPEGLPTVVSYGTTGFPKTAKSWPAGRGNLFAGGAGGTVKLVQQASVTPNARYDISG